LPRILIVDDNGDAADTLGMLMKGFDCEVAVAYSGAEALVRGETFMPQLILLDIGMPIMDGCETARCMRETRWGQSAVIVALTAWSDEATRRRVAAAGMDYHITKPASLDLMLDLVAALRS